MGTDAGRDVIRRLAAMCDVVLNNFTAEVMTNWGLSYDDLKQIKPDIIAVDMQGLGHTGPYRGWRTNGMQIMAYAGMTKQWTLPDAAELVGSQSAHPDYVAPTHAAFAILAALWYRNLTGLGQHIDLSQAEVTAATLGAQYLDATVNGQEPPQHGNGSPDYAPYGCYPCLGHDAWCVIAAETENQWQAMKQVMGEPAWADDPRFAALELRLQHGEELNAHIAEWTRTLTPGQVMYRLQKAGVPAGAVQNGEDMFRDFHLRERGYVIPTTTPDGMAMEMPGIIVRMSGTPGHVWRDLASTGQDNLHVFSGLSGMTDQEIDALTEEGVLR
jgi:crotonobetainyl-CoA:carnitine CoA-transferase CaiB-like acyl-CoA transferase